MPIEQMMNLKSLRARAGMTQEHAAVALGVTRATISNWEKYSSSVPIKYMYEFSELYKYPLDGIFFGSSIALSKKIRDKTDNLRR